MGAASAVKLFAAGSAWRLAGVSAAGRVLVSAVTGLDPDDRVLGGILLARASDRSVPLIASALANGAHPADLVDVLASIGSDAAYATLQTAARSPGPELAASARRALDTIDQMRRNPD